VTVVVVVLIIVTGKVLIAWRVTVCHEPRALVAGEVPVFQDRSIGE
jgi:hypothetical protein